MGSSGDHPVGIDVLEKRLLEEEEPILYDALFDEEMEERYVRYQTAWWVLYSLLLVLAWGIGLLMLAYLPVRRHVLRKDFRSRKLHLTPDAIVYKVTRPIPIPCLGVLKKEKYIILPSVADVAVEQGYLQSLFRIYSIRIENIGLRRPSNDDVHIDGIANPRAFRKAVLTRLYSLKGKSLGSCSINEEMLSSSSAHPFEPSTPFSSVPPHSGGLIIQKLEEVDCSVKRVQSLLEKMPPHSTYSMT